MCHVTRLQFILCINLSIFTRLHELEPTIISAQNDSRKLHSSSYVSKRFRKHFRP